MALINYLPAGTWINWDGSTFVDLLGGFDDSTESFRAWLTAIIDELDPRTTTDLLTEWARLVDVELTGTIADQRTQIVEALTVDQIKTQSFFIAIAAANGDVLDFWEYHDMQIGFESDCIQTGLEDGCGIHSFDGVDFASFTHRMNFTIASHSDLDYVEAGLEAGCLEAGSAVHVFGLTDSEFEIMRYFPKTLSAIFYYNKGYLN